MGHAMIATTKIIVADSGEDLSRVSVSVQEEASVIIVDGKVVKNRYGKVIS